MSEYAAAVILPPEASDSIASRLRKAETLARIGLTFRFDQPLPDLLRSLAASILEETGAVAAAVLLLKPDDLSVAAQGECNLPAGYLEGLAIAYQDPTRAATLRDAVREGRTWVMRDGPAYMLSVPEYAHMHHLLHDLPFQTMVTTPFLERPETLGVIGLYYGGDAEVDQIEIDFARSIARQAAPVMDNAWLFSETQRRAVELEALSKADQALHESLQLDDVLRAMSDLAVDLLGADRSLLLAFDEQDRLHAHAARGVPDEELARLQEIYHGIGRGRFAGRTPELSVVEDVTSSTTINPDVKQVTSSASSVDVPVFVHGEFFGIFVLSYYERRTFSEDDRRLFKTLATRAGLAIQNALHFRETQRRTAELEALSKADQALHESIQLDDVLQAMSDLAVDLLGADSSLLLTWDEQDRLHAFAARGLEDAKIEQLQEFYHSISRSHYQGRRPELFISEDLANDPLVTSAIRRIAPAASSVDIPVYVDGEFFASFVLGYNSHRTFTDEDRRLFDTLAARAGLAMQNALHFRQTQRRAGELEALYHADEALHQSLNLADVVDAMVDLAGDLLQAESSLVVAWNDDDCLVPIAARGVPDDLLELVAARYASFGRDHFARIGPPFTSALIGDVAAQASFPPELARGGPASFAEVAVMVRGELWGLFSLGWRRTRTFSDADRRMFDAFASRASLAIQNAILYEQAQHSASMEERSRIARELHDSVSQALYGIGLGARTARRRLGDAASADVLEPVDYIVQLAESGLAETRALIFELVPESLAEQGLVLALQRQAAATKSRHRVEVAALLCDEPALSIRAKEALYRIAQEALHNVGKHAQATEVTLTLSVDDDVVTLVVKDNGGGFNTDGQFPGHLGLRSMEERARRVGGVYTVRSSPGAGTAVTVTVPLAG